MLKLQHVYLIENCFESVRVVSCFARFAIDLDYTHRHIQHMTLLNIIFKTH